jgi:O-antigen/teichoic acid export membrane protein
LPTTLQHFTARARALARRLKPQSTSSRNVLKLAGGTAGSQVISVAAAPFLTRLYGPEGFGVLATFASILALLNVVSSLRYELAIVVPEDDDEAVALVWLCFGLVAISTGLTVLGVLLLGDQLVGWLNEPAIKPLLWLLPVGVLLSGVYQPLSYWAVRRKLFGLLAQTKLRQSIFGVATNVAAAQLGTIGLLLGQIVSQSAGFVAILRQSGALLLIPAVTPAVLGRTLRRFSHFGIYDTPAGLINAIGNQVPNLIFASAFGAAQLGQLALAQRLLLLPVGLIGSAVGQVFLSQAAERYRTGTLLELIQQASRKLFLYGLAVAALACLVLAPLMPALFGKEWEPTRQIIPLLIPLFLGQLVVSPLSNAFIGSEAMRLGLVFQLALTAIRIIPLLLFSFSRPFEFVLLIYAGTAGAGYFLYLIGIKHFAALK